MRGQAYTLEGVFAAVVVVTAAVYGLQTVDTGPWTGGPSHRAETLETRARDVLTVAAEQGALSRAVRCYGDSKQLFNGATVGDPATDRAAKLELLLHRTFDSQGRSYNLYFSYLDSSGDRITEVVSSRSSASAPGRIAATATATVTLYDGQPIRFSPDGDGNPDCSQTGPAIGTVGTSIYPIEDVRPGSQVYNVVEVRLVVW